MSSLAEICHMLRGGEDGEVDDGRDMDEILSSRLLALHSLNELLLRSAEAMSVPELPPLLIRTLGLANAASQSPFASEVQHLCVRSLHALLDCDEGSSRAMAKPSAISVLAHTFELLGDWECGEQLVKVFSTLAASYPQSVLKSRALEKAFAILEFMPLSAKRSILHIGFLAAEASSNREDASLMLDLVPTLIRIAGDATALQATSEQAESGGHAAARASVPPGAVIGDGICVDTASRVLARFATNQAMMAQSCILQLSERRSSGGDGGGIPLWPLETLRHLIRLGLLEGQAGVLAAHCYYAYGLKPRVGSGGSSGGKASDREAALTRAMSGRSGDPSGPSPLVLLSDYTLRSLLRSLSRIFMLFPSLIAPPGTSGSSSGGRVPVHPRVGSSSCSGSSEGRPGQASAPIPLTTTTPAVLRKTFCSLVELVIRGVTAASGSSLTGEGGGEVVAPAARALLARSRVGGGGGRGMTATASGDTLDDCVLLAQLLAPRGS